MAGLRGVRGQRSVPTVANYRVDEHASCARIASLRPNEASIYTLRH
jgi:hypothetical protein